MNKQNKHKLRKHTKQSQKARSLCRAQFFVMCYLCCLLSLAWPCAPSGLTSTFTNTVGVARDSVLDDFFASYPSFRSSFTYASEAFWLALSSVLTTMTPVSMATGRPKRPDAAKFNMDAGSNTIHFANFSAEAMFSENMPPSWSPALYHMPINWLENRLRREPSSDCWSLVSLLAATLSSSLTRANFSSSAFCFASAARSSALATCLFNSAIFSFDSIWIRAETLLPTNADMKAAVTLIPPATAAIMIAKRTTDSHDSKDRPIADLPLWPLVFFLICLWFSIVGFIYLIQKRHRDRFLKDR